MKTDIILGTVGVGSAVLSAAGIYAAISTAATVICAFGIVIGWATKFFRIFRKWKNKEVTTEQALEETQKIIEEEVKPHANPDHHR